MTKLDKIDKRMFEYINHLYFGEVDHKDLNRNTPEGLVKY